MDLKELCSLLAIINILMLSKIFAANDEIKYNAKFAVFYDKSMSDFYGQYTFEYIDIIMRDVSSYFKKFYHDC